MNNNITRETIDKINTVIDRAYAMGIAGICGDTRFDHFMDIELAVRHFGESFDIDAMIAFDDFNFAHDFLGIRNHVDRPNVRFLDLFLPRCCR